MSMTQTLSRLSLFDQARTLLPGLMLCSVIALAATFVAEHHGGPQFLYALLIGIAFHFLADSEKCAPGIELAAKQLVRVGVALLGVRIGAGQIGELGIIGVAALIGSVLLTIGFGLLLSRLLKLPRLLGLLSGGATGICGISAALAISSTLPRSRDNERYTLLTVIGVAALSTTAMVFYPILVRILGLSGSEAGLFLGGAIHDVSQVVGAGFMISPEVGDAATLAKMFRVAMLMPVVIVLALLFRQHRRQNGEEVGNGVMPMFLVVFAVLVLFNSLGWISPPVVEISSEISRWCLVISIAALGVKTSFQKLAELGWTPIVLLTAEALFAAGYMLSVIYLLRVSANG